MGDTKEPKTELFILYRKAEGCEISGGLREASKLISHRRVSRIGMIAELRARWNEIKKRIISSSV